MPRACDRPGFTLVEVATAMAILAGVLLLTAPAIRRQSTGSDAGAETIEQLLERARRRAAREARTLAVDLDPDQGTVRVSTADAAGADSLLSETPLDIPSGVSVESGAPDGSLRVRFGALGRADGGPIRLRDARHLRLVEVDPWTGRTHVRAP